MIFLDGLAASFIRALCLTLVIEFFVAWLSGCRNKGEWLVLFFTNTLTNPLAMLFYHMGRWIFTGIPALPLQLLIEILVVVSEAWIYRSFENRENGFFLQPVKLSVFANLASWGTGVFFHYVIF